MQPRDTRTAARDGGGSLRHAWALLLLGLLVLPALALRTPAAGEDVALLFPPGTPAEQAMIAIAAADGLAVRQGGIEGLLVARFGQDLGWSDIWALGALAALDPAMAGACAALLPTSR